MSLEQVAGYCLFAAIVISMVVVPLLMAWEDPDRRKAQEAREAPEPEPWFSQFGGESVSAATRIVGLKPVVFNGDGLHTIVVDPSMGHLILHRDGAMTLQQHLEDCQAKAEMWRAQARQHRAEIEDYPTDNSPALGGQKEKRDA